MLNREMQSLHNTITKHNFSEYGFAKLNRPLSIQVYRQWLDDSLHADLHYLERHYEAKETPQKLMQKATSAIVFRIEYKSETKEDFPLKNLKIASYARQEDYHLKHKQRLEELCIELRELYPKEEFIAFTDSSPVLERDLAYRAGLGWFGKNSCLIDRDTGSYFFIAEIYTTKSLDVVSELSKDFCGTCTRCIEACPTDAILENRTLDTKKCISYWNIESKEIPPENIRDQFSAWLFGCDICQDVCPWNIKAYPELKRLGAMESPTTTDSNQTSLIDDLKWILNNSNRRIMKELHGTPLVRAGGRGLKRNAIIVIANLQLKELSHDVSQYLENTSLKELSAWCLKKLSIS